MPTFRCSSSMARKRRSMWLADGPRNRWGPPAGQIGRPHAAVTVPYRRPHGMALWYAGAAIQFGTATDDGRRAVPRAEAVARGSRAFGHSGREHGAPTTRAAAACGMCACLPASAPDRPMRRRRGSPCVRDRAHDDTITRRRVEPGGVRVAAGGEVARPSLKLGASRKGGFTCVPRNNKVSKPKLPIWSGLCPLGWTGAPFEH